MAETPANEAPQTLEGWFVLHTVHRLDWGGWRKLAEGERAAIAGEAARWLQAAANCGDGDSAAFSVLTNKGDLLFLHYRATVEALKRVELSLCQLRLFDFLQPGFSYLSVIELSLAEVTAIVAKKLADQGLTDDQAAFDKEMAVQKKRLEGRLRPVIPGSRFLCFYPMSKRRGEQVNWYTLPAEERRTLMRGHGKLGHKYNQQVSQVISGSIGLDDWEWAVSLHGDDCLAFKKLIHEMRFDPASALYAEFGQFYLGIRQKPAELPDLLAGKLG